MTAGETFPLWADNPAERDLLGFTDVVVPVLETVRRDRLDPVGVGLIGPWGSGKSTILGLLAAELRQDKSMVVVDTRPWEYDPALDIKATLIGHVLAEIAPRIEKEQGKAGTAKGLAAKLAKRVRWTKAVTLAAKTAVTLQMPSWDAIEGLVKSDEEGDEEADPTLAGFRREFSEFVQSSTVVTRVVVLVDDLDRCLPETVIATLEGIKLFLAVPKMAFVIGYDEAPVVDAIKTRYRESDAKAEMARQYLEKIVQVPVRVPNLGLAGTEAYLGLMLAEPRINDAELFEKLAIFAETRRQAGRVPFLEGHGLQFGSEADKAINLAAALAPILYKLLQGNPRRLKRFLNAFWIRSSIAKSRGIELDPAALAKLVVLEELYRERFAELIQWSAEGVLAERLAKLEADDAPASESWSRPDLRDWATLRPPLAGLNLVPYLQLAASLSQLSFVASGLSAELQRLLGSLVSDSDASRKTAAGEAKGMPAQDRQALLNEIVDAIRREPSRQGQLADTLASLVDGDDEVAKPLVERLAGLDPQIAEASLVHWLRPLAGLPSMQGWFVNVRDDERYPGDVRAAAKGALEPIGTG
jgi:hypothetical protein